MRKHYEQSRLEKLAAEVATSVSYRTYENGNSCDTRRTTNLAERNIIFGIVFGALVTLNHGESHRGSRTDEQAILDTAESIVDISLPGCNGYDTVYCPLRRILREWETV